MIRLPSVTGIDPRLLSTLAALGDYLQDVVVVGGWVPHIYRKIWPSESPVEARRTFDLDAAVGGPLTVRSRSRLDVLLAAEGYTPTLGGANGPAAQIYQSPPDSDLLPIEFLAPLTGRREQATIQIQEGVTAQALRYLNILLENTLEVRVSTEALAGSRDELTGAHTDSRRLRLPQRVDSSWGVQSAPRKGPLLHLRNLGKLTESAGSDSRRDRRAARPVSSTLVSAVSVYPGIALPQ